MRYQINILKIIKGLNLIFFKGSKGQQDAHQQLDDKISFKHHRVKRTAQKMSTTKNLDALINLLDDFSEFIYLNDDEFARESMIMLFLVEKNIIINHAIENKSPITLDQVIALYEVIESLPIEKLLEAIDLLGKAFSDILDQTEESSGNSWSTIFKENWWSMPMAGVFFIFKLWKFFNV